MKIDTMTGAPVEPPPGGPAVELPVVAAVAYLPSPGYTLVNITADHSQVCGHWHRHVSPRLADDDLIRHPPCRMGSPYRLDVRIAARSVVSVHAREAS